MEEFCMTVSNLSVRSLVLALLVTAGASAWADEPAVDTFTGAFVASLPVEVPRYRGLEPAIGLDYNSGGGNGLAGQGVVFRAGATIERASAGRGAPAYTSADIYLLDGEELVASTALGGTHATKKQSYVRATFNSTANVWYVTRKDGIKSTFSPVLGTVKGTFRWAVTRVEDPRGNSVTYSYWTDTGKEVYPTQVAYNGVAVNFYWELRTDVITTAIGATLAGGTSGLATIRYRLKTIDVLVGGSRLRAYKLTYAQAANAHAQSLLTAFQQFGRDATVDGLGTITNEATASKTPAIALGWAQPSGLSAETYLKNQLYGIDSDGSRKTLGDLNGDGLTDYIYERSDTNYLQVMLSTGNGLGPESTWASRLYGVSAGVWSLVDLNGDGKDDYVYSRKDTKEARVLLSTGTGFQAEALWGTRLYSMGCDGACFWFQDMNGDGKADFVYQRDGTNEFRVLLSTGSSFAAEYVMFTRTYQAAGSGSDNQNWFADVNGDGYPDMVYQRDGNYEIHVLLNRFGQGLSTFGPDTVWATRSWGKDIAGVADFNGDGRVDYFFERDGTNDIYIFLSNGDSFGPQTYWGTRNYTMGGDGKLWWAQDMDGDGLADLVYQRDGTTYFYILKSTGSTFKPEALWFIRGYQASYSGANNANWFVDINGDGMPDHLYKRDGTYEVRLLYSQGAMKPLVTSATNRMGGSVSVAYTRSSAFANSNNPPVTPCATSLTVSDGRGGAATSQYSYSGGLYDRVSRRSLGFRYAKTTQPKLSSESYAPYTEAWYKQDYGSVGKPERTDRRDGYGRLLISQAEEYTTNGATIPYTSNNTGTWAYAYDGTGAACSAWPCAYGSRTYVSRAFDAYANIVTEVQYGDYDVAGDEKTTSTIFRPNTTSYLVALPAVTRLYDGAGTGGTLLEEVLTTYDANATWDAAPTIGLPVKSQRLASTTPSYLETRQEYDTYGNVTAEIAPSGAKTAHLLDATYHMFRVESRDPLYHGLGAVAGDTRHKKTMVNDPVCGAETQEVSKSGLSITRQYDALCRLTRLDDGSGYFELHGYYNAGSATAQYVEVQTPAADGSGNQWRRQYLDGQGRAYKTVAKGPAVGQDIIDETTYTPRNQIAARTLPYYTGETPKWLTVTHDALNRVTRTAHPDGGFESKSYGVGVVTTTDELGVARAEYKDGLGRISKRRQWRAGVALDTTYSYNARGQATQITDHKGNQFKVTYNLLGQRATFVDPNRGTTSYEYNEAGHNSAVIDALGNRIEYGYDLLGRKTAQVEKLANGTVERSLSWTYDQARSGYYNVGGLTTVTDGLGTSQLDYDLKGHLVRAIRVLDGASYTFTHAYDVGGRLLHSTLPDGDTIGTAAAPRTFDGAGRPKTVPGYVTNAAYNARGQLVTLTRANGTTTSFTYDANRAWLTDIYTSSGSVIQNLHYTRDALGRTTQVQSAFADEGWSYAYDELGFLTSATSLSASTHNQTFAYDTTGNLTSVVRPGGGTWAYTYNSPHGATSVRPHAVVAAGANAYTYDAAGNMLTGAGRTIVWGVNGLPKQVNGDAYAYDANNVRVKKVVGATTTHYVSGEYEVTGSTVTKYVDFQGEAVAKKVGPTKYYLHQDGLGSVQAVTDSAGIEVARMKFRPYGERLSTGGAHVESRSFTGQRQDETGLFYLNARYYDPQLGRFISADPVVPSADTVGLNRYAYAGNDPINNLDTNGLSFFSKIKNFFKKIVKAVVNVIKGLVNLVKAALHGDWKAIATIVILVATIALGGMALAWAVQAATGATAAAIAEVGTMAFAFQSTAGALAYAGMSAAVGFGSSFSIGLVQTGSVSAALKAGVNGAIGGVLNTAMNFALFKAGVITANQMGTDIESDGTYKIGLSDKRLNMEMSDVFSQKKGYFNSAPGQLMAQHVHDPFASWLKGIITGLGPKDMVSQASLLERNLYAVLNISTAFVFQAAAEAITTSVIEQAFGKMHETPYAAINQLNGATSFFSIPKNLPPGVTREMIARSAIRIRW
jgi:RHS repeat-associated protein